VLLLENWFPCWILDELVQWTIDFGCESMLTKNKPIREHIVGIKMHKLVNTLVIKIMTLYYKFKKFNEENNVSTIQCLEHLDVQFNLKLAGHCS
jgi:ribosome biogenesis SPOUT family RNA methylase Rps3